MPRAQRAWTAAAAASLLAFMSLWLAGEFVLDLSDDGAETYTSWLLAPAAAVAVSTAAAGILAARRISRPELRTALTVAAVLAAVLLTGLLYVNSVITIENGAD